jgi:hypothetical protein
VYQACGPFKGWKLSSQGAVDVAGVLVDRNRPAGQIAGPYSGDRDLKGAAGTDGATERRISRIKFSQLSLLHWLIIDGGVFVHRFLEPVIYCQRRDIEYTFYVNLLRLARFVCNLLFAGATHGYCIQEPGQQTDEAMGKN